MVTLLGLFDVMPCDLDVSVASCVVFGVWVDLTPDGIAELMDGSVDIFTILVVGSGVTEVVDALLGDDSAVIVSSVVTVVEDLGLWVSLWFPDLQQALICT